MQNKNKLFGLLMAVFALCAVPAYADDEGSFDFMDEETIVTDDAGDMVVTSVADYDVNGSLFQQITDLEQEKVLMELEKERAQLDLDLDRLAAEKIKLQMEMDTLSGRAEQEQRILQNEKSKLEAEAARIENEKRALAAAAEAEDVKVADNGAEYKASAAPAKKKPAPAPKKEVKEVSEDISTMYKLVNVMGAGNQLQATLSDLETGQTKRVSVGKKISGFTVKSISLEDGVVFSKDGEIQNLNISSR